MDVSMDTSMDIHIHGNPGYIDYLLASTTTLVNDFAVLDPDINCSDHLPLVASCLYSVSRSGCNSTCSKSSTAVSTLG